MKDAFFIKMPGGQFIPATDHDRELTKSVPAGAPVRLSYSRPRNYEFHKKFFALLNYLYDCWEPELKIGKHNLVPEKNFERFRADITILAGFYRATYRVNGDIRYEPKSISWAKMSEDEFEKLYQAVIDVGLKYICKNYSEPELRRVLEEGLMEFS